MTISDNILSGLYGYESLMLLCGFVLFVFTLAAIAMMLLQRRDFKSLIVPLLILPSVIPSGE